MAKDKKETTQDYLDSIDELLLTIKGVNPKRLLDEDQQLISRSFEANGNTYVVLNVEQSYNVARAEAHAILEMMFAKAKSLEQMHADDKKSVELIDNMFLQKSTFSDLVKHLKNKYENYYKDNLQRKHIALYECTLFIVRAGDDITDWSFPKAEQYITDWLKEGIYAPDFFFLAIQRFPNYTRILREGMEIGLIKQIQEEENEKKKRQDSKPKPKSNKKKAKDTK